MAGPTRLSWICSTLTEFRLRALRLSRLYLFAIRTRYAPSVRKSAELTICVSRHWHSAIKKSRTRRLFLMAGPTRLELATSCVTGRHSNQLSYDPTTIFNFHFWNVAQLVLNLKNVRSRSLGLRSHNHIQFSLLECSSVGS